MQPQLAKNWPPFTLDPGETATAGDGVTGTIGSVTRSDGSKQVSYNGLPVYYFAGDSEAGDTTGQGSAASGSSQRPDIPAGWRRAR